MAVPTLMQAPGNFGELVRDPALTVACVLLVFSSMAWIVGSRLIWRNLKRGAARRAEAERRRASRRAPAAPRDIWKEPPPR